MIKQSNFVICALLSLSLLAQQRAYGQYNNDVINTCPSGQYAACTFDQSSTTNWQWWTTSSGMPATTPQTTTTQAPQVCIECSRGTAAGTATNSYNYNYYYSTNYYNGCIQCYAGYYANRTGADLCELCPTGYSCADPAQDPKPCPKGFYCPNLPNLNYYMNFFEINIPLACPENTYASKEGSVDCLPCPAGYDCVDRANPVKCPKGTATESGVGCMWDNSVRCKTCSDGWVATKEGSATCTRCPEGYMCPDRTQIIKCPAGTYRNSSKSMTNGTEARQCTRCPAGQYQTSEGQRSCKMCPKGYYCPVPHISPIKCPTGTFSVGNQQRCYPCPDGTYANTTGNSKCNKCPNGYYCNDPNIGPQLCPLGTYSNSRVGQVICSQCPPGTYTAKTGSSECTNCPDGMCCDDPSSPPTQCDFDFGSTPDAYTTSGWSWTWSS